MGSNIIFWLDWHIIIASCGSVVKTLVYCLWPRINSLSHVRSQLLQNPIISFAWLDMYKVLIKISALDLYINVNVFKRIPYVMVYLILDIVILLLCYLNLKSFCTSLKFKHKKRMRKRKIMLILHLRSTGTLQGWTFNFKHFYSYTYYITPCCISNQN